MPAAQSRFLWFKNDTLIEKGGLNEIGGTEGRVGIGRDPIDCH
jgi:hypothetical protein